MLAHDEPPFGVDRQAVGADRPQTGPVPLEHRIDEGTRTLGLGPLVDRVAAHIGKQQARLASVPDRPLGEDEAVGELVNAGVGWHQRVESRVDPKDGAGAGVRWEGGVGLFWWSVWLRRAARNHKTSDEEQRKASWFRPF